MREENTQQSGQYRPQLPPLPFRAPTLSLMVLVSSLPRCPLLGTVLACTFVLTFWNALSGQLANRVTRAFVDFALGLNVVRIKGKENSPQQPRQCSRVRNRRMFGAPGTSSRVYLVPSLLKSFLRGQAGHALGQSRCPCVCKHGLESQLPGTCMPLTRRTAWVQAAM